MGIEETGSLTVLPENGNGASLKADPAPRQEAGNQIDAQSLKTGLPCGLGALPCCWGCWAGVLLPPCCCVDVAMRLLCLVSGFTWL